MRRDLLIQSWKLDLISRILWKSKKALKQKLWRDWKTIDDVEYILELIKK
jgi:hypothetical protein